MNNQDQPITYTAYRRDIKRLLPDCVDYPNDEKMMRRAYVRGLSVRGAILWLT